MHCGATCGDSPTGERRPTSAVSSTSDCMKPAGSGHRHNIVLIRGGPPPQMRTQTSRPHPTPAAVRDAVRGLASSTTGTARVWALTVVLAAIALALAAAELPAGPPARAPVALPWWVLAAVFYLTEAKVVHLHIGRSAHSFSMSEIPVVYGIFFLAPGEFIVARLIGAGLAFVVNRRRRSGRLALSLAQVSLCSVVTVGVVQLLVG